MGGYEDPYGFSKNAAKASSSKATYTDPYGFSGGAAPSGGGGHHGIFGVLENLGSDVKGAVEGLPIGVAKTVGAFGKTTAFDLTGGDYTGLLPHSYGHALLDTLKPIGESYAKTYSPLFHGKFGQFGHELYAHPLGPILDAATVATLGAGGVAKAGALLDKAGALSEGSRLANLGKASDLTVPDFGGGEDIVVKQSSRNPLVRLRQTTTNDLLNRLPSETPVVGSTARGIRALMRDPERAAARLQGAAQHATATFGNLSKEERVAWHLKARGLTPKQYADYLGKTGEKVSPSFLQRLNDPKVAELVSKPSKNLQAALEAGHALSNHLTALRVAGGHIDELTAVESPYRHLRLVNGAKHEMQYEPIPEKRISVGQVVTPADRRNIGRVVSIDRANKTASVHFHDRATGLEETKTFNTSDLLRPTGIRLAGGKDLETLMREQGNEQPFHVPDSAHTGGLRSRFSTRPSGFAAPVQGVKQSRGVLFSKGLIHFDENSLAKDYRSFAGQARAQLIHDELVKHAAILPKGEPIPHGYEELKLNRGQASAPYTVRAAGDLEHELAGGGLRAKLSDLSRKEIEQGNPAEPHTLIVPRQVRKIVEDNSRSYRGNLRRLAFDLPTNVWKHLILGLRPAFFGNITIGNSILGTLQMAPGRWGVLGWLNQVVPGFERLAGPKLSAETMREVFPEQAYGTFGHDVGFSPNAGLRTAQKVYQGVMPATIAYENVLRRAMAEGWAKADPEVQVLMRRNGGDVNEALRVIAQTKPQIISGISRRVDDALGNYRTYNRLERALKAVVPFYGWNRHLTASVTRLALERPQVLDALFQTGEQGKPLADKILAALPDYLQGSVGVNLPSWLGGVKGKEQLLTMQSLNPFNTLLDEGQVLAAPLGKAGASSDAFPLNPFAQAAIEQLTGKSLLTGHDIKGNAIANEAENLTPLESMLRDLIHGRHPKPTATNQNNELGQLLRYLGVPVENVNPGGASAKSGKASYIDPHGFSKG